MTPADDAGSRQRPPSFTPQSGGSRRPRSASDAVPVGAPEAEPNPTRLMPASSSTRPPVAPARRSMAHAPAPTGRPTAGRPPTDRSPGARAAQPTPADAGGRPRKRRRGRVALIVAGIVILCLIAWPVGLVLWANGKLQHTDALSAAAQTSGTTYLIAGSDSRAETDPGSSVKGARTDSILLLHVPESGPTALISIPRDTYAQIPGHNPNKINAAYSFGGAPLLVETVEELTGMKIDHYVEIGFGGVEDVVDAVDGVRLCLDYDVDDKKSHLKWKSGCHTVGGKKALAFSRMRYADPEGDIGRAKRQRQVIAAVSEQLKNPALLVKPGSQVALIKAGAAAVTFDEDADVLTMARLALAFRAANGPDGITGTPPIKTLNYRPGGVGSAIQLDPDLAPAFWTDIRDGKLPAGEVGGMD